MIGEGLWHNMLNTQLALLDIVDDIDFLVATSVLKTVKIYVLLFDLIK